MSENRLRVFSLNCWGLKFVAKNRTERVAAIAAELAKSDYDIISLQELWVYADYEHVRQSVSCRLPHAKFFYSGALGAGLVIFSRFPIISASVHPYSLNGEPIDVAAGDWFVGKAAASILIAHPVLGQVQIFNTHLFAKGGEDGPEHNRAHRLVNAWEFSKLANQAAELGRYVIAAGDFNSIPTTLPMTIIRDHANLVDAWVASHPPSVLSIDQTSPRDMITHYGVTSDSPLNSYSAGKPLDPHARKHLGKRLNYIFYRQPKRHEIGVEGQNPAPVLSCSNSKVVFTENVPGHNFSYSDHFGLEATLDIHLPEVYPSPPTKQLDAASITTTIQALTSCYRFSRYRSSRELIVFGLCILLILGLIISSAWLPKSWINPIFVIFTVFVTWLGTTMLYEGFLYGRWELNALMSVIEELEMLRKHLDSRQGPSSPDSLGQGSW